MPNNKYEKTKTCCLHSFVGVFKNSLGALFGIFGAFKRTFKPYIIFFVLFMIILS